MARLDFQPLFRKGLTAAALATTVLLAACGPGQGSSSTTVVLTGPAEWEFSGSFDPATGAWARDSHESAA